MKQQVVNLVIKFYDKVTKREEMWVKLRELEAKADDPNRFVNRYRYQVLITNLIQVVKN